MTTLHLVCGAAGAGKTTHALRLCEELGALHLSIDDWMVTLFGPDAPQPPQWPWIAERVARCEAQILRTAVACARRGLPVVLDLSFLRADQRARAAQAAREAGLDLRLHLLDPGPEERWRRVEARNAAQGETYRVTVTRPMFDFIESLWQRPSPEEMAALNGHDVRALHDSAPI
ncbi:AAA family ATPase [Rubellimicrobium roseum]|uniref:AAA family ATPase n=1 Tax=Rubellimicrobium roseum TaxID=687525 RepID=UPI00159B8D91|nr:ATP-binding protein [Rubellimicrobium roseum]